MDKETMEMNAKIQQKKNALRKELGEMGILKRESENKYDGYKYFSEAQYKSLFTQLFGKHGLELKANVDSYETFTAEGKQSNGRLVTMRFTLIDSETGFEETSIFFGEGMDKGDKAGYKAYTGALKYYLADTFMVATGDDPEKDSPEENMNKVNERKASAKQIEMISRMYADKIADILAHYGVSDISDLPMNTASYLISRKGKNNG